MIKAMCYVCGKLIKEGDRIRLQEIAYNCETGEIEPVNVSDVFTTDTWNLVIKSIRNHSAIKHEDCKVQEIER